LKAVRAVAAKSFYHFEEVLQTAMPAFLGEPVLAAFVTALPALAQRMLL
jgi:hypothetical protein